MVESVSLWQRLLIGGTAVLWFALMLMALLGYPVVGALPWWMIALVIIAGVVLCIIPFALRWLFKRSDPTWGGKTSFAAFALAGIMAITGLVGLPFYYLAYWVDSGPTSIPLATLTNGKKTVVFQGMQHVGSEGFYKSVVFDLEKALSDGYTLFYEGVQPVEGRKDLDEWFNKDFLGSNTDLSSGYTKLAEGCGLTFQLNYFVPILADKAIHPKKHVTADVTYLDMKNEYDRLLREDPDFAAAMVAKQAAAKTLSGKDPFVEALSFAATATPAQKNLVGIACRGILARVMSGGSGGKPDPTKKIILDFRNKALARFVADSTASKIYITYGAEHFRGFVADLKAIDPAFDVVSLNWSRAMSNPREASPPPGNWPAVVKR
jgi:hypothetical protein